GRREVGVLRLDAAVGRGEDVRAVGAELHARRRETIDREVDRRRALFEQADRPDVERAAREVDPGRRSHLVNLLVHRGNLATQAARAETRATWRTCASVSSTRAARRSCA